MDFATDAVLDVAAPPSPRAPAKSGASADSDGPSFDEHLSAAIEDDASADCAPAPVPSPSAQTSPDTESAPVDGAAIVVGSQPAAPTPVVASQHVVQVIADTAPSAAPAEAAPPAVAPTTTTPNAVAPEGAAVAPALAPDAAADASQTQAAGSDASASMDQAQAAPSQTAQPNQAPAQPAPVLAAAIPSPQPATPTPQSNTSPDAAVAAAAAPNAAALAAQEAAHRGAAAQPNTGKSDAKGADIEPTAPRDAQASPPATAQGGPKPNAKAAPAPVAAKDAVTLDASAPTSQNAPAMPAPQSAAQTQHAAPDQFAVRAAPAAYQVGREIVRRFGGESTRFELRLDPPELGRVEVRLEVSRDHRVNAMISADSPQALTELARHARELEQMLQSAGLELGDSGLSFDLRQGREGADATPGERASAGEASGDASVEQAAPQARPLGYERWRGVRVDMMV